MGINNDEEKSSVLRKRRGVNNNEEEILNEVEVKENIRKAIEKEEIIIENNKKGINKLDIIFVLLFLILGIFSRFYVIWHPNEVVFDEQHFGNFVNGYLDGSYFLDIHPPLGKLLLALSGYIGGYNGQYKFDEQGQLYTDNTYLSLRFLPALCGALLVPLMYLTARAMKLSPTAASIAAWMVLCENSIITESRLILCDSFLLFLICCL
eukprot:TRINITY_DN2964_c7_g1_i1.p2 TRINITY_DN2964_c7_g1~~TRINITY_DN2964_c7_g1_i1.p2  ORF type:complete len:208 (-),score=51.28 TRINITY_DN2964_c7_g1_i1:1069-1692(-)